MEMLDRMDALECAPVLEPDHVLPSTFTDEDTINKIVDLPSSCWSEISIGLFFRDGSSFEIEFRPYYQVDDSAVDAVRPVVVENLVVV